MRPPTPIPATAHCAEAINSANALPGTDTIAFNLPGSTQISITDHGLADPFPAITDDVVVDGETQPGTTPGKPSVQVDGVATSRRRASASTSPAASTAARSAGSRSRASASAGISLEGPPSVVEGNYVGLAPNGVARSRTASGTSSFEGGIEIRSANNRRRRLDGRGAQRHLRQRRRSGIAVRQRVGEHRHRQPHRDEPGRRRRRSRTPDERHHGSRTSASSSCGGTGARRGQPHLRQHRRRDLLELGLRLRDGDVPGQHGRPRGGRRRRRCRTAAAGIRLESRRRRPHRRNGGPAPGTSSPATPAQASSLDVGSRTVLQGNRIGTTANGLAAAPNARRASVAVSCIDGADRHADRRHDPGRAQRHRGRAATSDRHLLSRTAPTQRRRRATTSASAPTARPPSGTATAFSSTASRPTTRSAASVPGAGNVDQRQLARSACDIDTAGSGNKVLGNTIGTDAGETTVAGLGNDIGVEVTNTSGTTVGSTSPGAGNVIGGSFDAG